MQRTALALLAFLSLIGCAQPADPALEALTSPTLVAEYDHRFWANEQRYNPSRWERAKALCPTGQKPTPNCTAVRVVATLERAAHLGEAPQ